jgi:cation diffusion facilitator CzcD-associated flavoprotein CzcO
MSEDTLVDVLIVGAGLSGIGAACHLQRECPDRNLAIVEARDDLGGTWDLFRYPGVRSDSDMYTLGYSFAPWTRDKTIADGATILAYLRETARAHGIDRRIRFGHRVRRAEWSSDDALWTVELTRASGDIVRIRCAFLLMCCGYYDYAQGHTPDFSGRASFTGRIVHPQHWTDDIAWGGRRVVVIGSGATAVSLVPEIAKDAAHVTLLQRSPSYVLSRPSVDPVARGLLRWFGPAVSHRLSRWKNVLMATLLVQACKRWPGAMRNGMLKLVRRQLAPGFDVATHFTPRYNPWEQRLCLVPDGDLFKSIRAGRVSIVTDSIERFTETGLLLASGTELPADLIVTATGLRLKTLDHVVLQVDGRAVVPSELVNYKGLMFGGVPNMAFVFGYTNASWTLKADLASVYVCRLLNHMRATGMRRCVPAVDDAALPLAPWTDFSSGYFQRAISELPRQGATHPWKLRSTYFGDAMALRYGAIDDGVLRFSA